MKNIYTACLLLIFSLLINVVLLAQENAVVHGIIKNEKNKAVELANIAIEGFPGGTTSNQKGAFTLEVPAGEINLLVSYVGYNALSVPLNLKAGEQKMLRLELTLSTTNLPGLVIEDRQVRSSTLTPISPKEATVIPSMSGNAIEALVQTQIGVSSNNELSSQYSVRGGNYDENLVYVNDIEIYKPFLVRSGQQEGLSFLNSDLVSSILFSAGGFQARYGDKMSSVLDIKYKRPEKFAGSVNLSLLGGGLHLEGATKNKKLSYLFGARQKSNQYLLSSLQTKGEYRPSFTDVQGMLMYKINPKWEVSVLGNFANNSYKLVPEDRQTDFGTVQEAYRLSIYFEGQENDKFQNYTGAATVRFKPQENLSLKLIASTFHTDEQENYDLLGQYWIGRLETQAGSETFGEVVEANGVGSYLNHARNKLVANVYNIEHRGLLNIDENIFEWGFRYQHEDITDHLNEWEMIDSAGFSLPRPADSIGYTVPDLQNIQPLVLNDVIKTDIDLQSNRYTGFVQGSWTFPASDITLTAGLRGNYWDVNKQFLLSPRANIAWKPNWERDVMFRFSTGYYYQPPFYRELRNDKGEINKDLKAQTSIHFVAGMDWNFMAWGRPFKFVSEAYYKYLDNLIPYVVDNVRLRYSAENLAYGYAAGIDFKINGEFVKGVDSWASLSIMKTEEDIENDFYFDYLNAEGEVIIPGYTEDQTVVDSVRIKPGFIPRPTDQRVSFSLFFQDYLPGNPTWRMQLRLVFGTGLPFGPPKSEKYEQTYRMPAYRRVDIGFSKELVGENTRDIKSGPFRFIESAFITAEVFNLLQFSNTVSYLWVTDVTGRKYAVPNYLTPRQLNVRLVVNF